jgi:drug/metabolite transporter (DMT)-like permease
MTTAGWVALGIAVFGAICYGAASVLQAIGARRSTSTVKTMGHPLYLLGTAADILGWAGSMVALRELAVYQVQSILAGSLVVTVVLARLVLSSRLRGIDVVAVMVTICALTVLAMSAGPQEQVVPSNGLRIGLCAAAAALAVLGYAAGKFAPPGVVAALAGTAFGGSALAGRALPMPEHPTRELGATAISILTEPLSAALLVFAAAGMLLYANALQRGPVGPVTAVLWIGEVVAPSAVGLAVLGDTVLPGWNLPSGIAGAVIVVAAVVLSTAPATSAAVVAETAPISPPVRAIGRFPVRTQYGTTLWWGPPSNPQPIWRPPDRDRMVAVQWWDTRQYEQVGR